jgi:hypothetical protein
MTEEEISILLELIKLYVKNYNDDYSVSSLEEVILKEEELKKKLVK